MNFSDRQLLTSESKFINNPADYSQGTQQLSEHIIFTSLDDLYVWAHLFSLEPLLCGTVGCLMEFAALTCEI